VASYGEACGQAVEFGRFRVDRQRREFLGTAQTLLDDASRLAERARKAGVAVSYEPSEDMIHVWHLFASMLDEGQQAIDRIGEFVRKHAA
jgi:acetyl esterase/lipase